MKSETLSPQASRIQGFLDDAHDADTVHKDTVNQTRAWEHKCRKRALAEVCYDAFDTIFERDPHAAPPFGHAGLHHVALHRCPDVLHNNPDVAHYYASTSEPTCI